jgi:hypothetical protein
MAGPESAQVDHVTDALVGFLQGVAAQAPGDLT